ncbi:PAS domain S-box protein [bacterium]|nr:PAS domain S-box protein [bacterium]
MFKNKFSYWLILIICSIVSMFFFSYSYNISVNTIDKLSENKIESEYEYLKSNIDYFQKDRKAYLSILTNNQVVKDYLNVSNEANKNKLEKIFIEQISMLDFVMQLRIISLEGKELLRVDKNKNEIKIIPLEKLQNKSNRDYFRKFILLEQDEIGISSLDLNEENGIIEKPFNSTLRISMPVFDKGVKKALIVINYSMNNWLEQFVKSSSLNIYLLDSDGFFIVHPDNKFKWSKYLEPQINSKDIFDIEKEYTKNITLWDDKQYTLIYDFKDTNDKRIFVDQSKWIGFITIIGILILILPFIVIIYKYIKELKNNEKKVNRILDNAFDSVLMIDSKGIIQTINAVTSKTFGYTKEELIGKNVNILIPEPHHSKHDDYLKSHNPNLMAKVLGSQRELFGLSKSNKLIPINLAITKFLIDSKMYFIGTIRNVSEEKETKKLFENVFTKSPLGIALVLDDGSFWRLNDNFCNTVGYSQDELMKLTFQDITHADDLNKDLEFVNKLITKELDSYSLEKRYIHKDGTIVWINLSVRPIFLDDKKEKLEFFIAMIENITERKLILEKLDITTKRLMQAEEISLLGHWDWDILKDSLYWSDTMLVLFGKKNENFHANYESFIECVYEEDRSLVNIKVQDSFDNNTPFDMEYRIVVKDKIKIIHAKGTTTYLDGKPIRMFGTCQDITEIKELYEKQQNQEYFLMQQSKLASMGEMVASIAHQWRQPLNSIGLSVQDILPAYKNNEVNEEYIIEIRDEMMEQLNYMSNTIDEFRNFFKKSNTLINFNILDSIEEIISLYWAQLNESSIFLSIEVSYNNDIYKIDDLPEELKEKFILASQPSELKQIIINCIANAKDAIESLNTIDKIEENIDIIISKNDNYNFMQIAIIDFAGGIDDSNIERIFEPYFTTKEMGTGLGLYICEMIARKSLNGKIKYEKISKEVASKLYKGSKFIIEFPIQK